ncbi:alpha/beta-hydrolase [Aspergillus affinis]|uniref:alpha/beta-hydrolase n=1 Tax=Aspergillus affinis TaxID=1070780 RepID=UPI0022FF41D5|nr:alpha/beta-hydrolase [Aspergillus affinis]KAI9043301.1 alpha/beta-hydrolase [Aspergillus affinis]
MSLLNYIYLKIAATVVRLFVRMAGKITSSPDVIRTIPSRDSKRVIPIHIYKPTRQTSEDQPTPVLINFHGSGFMIATHGSDDAFCRQVSRQTHYTVVDVSYRLAPEYPFPAALEDAEDAIDWVLGQKKLFNTSQVALSGFSAGGTIILSLASTIYSPETFYSVVAFYPAVDWTIDARAKKAPNPNGQSIPIRMMRLFSDALFQSQVDFASPYVSPLYADPECFPDRLLIVTADGDCLAPEAEALVEKLQTRTHGHVIHFRALGCNHAWDKVAKTMTGTIMRRNAYALAVDMLNS